MPRRRHSGRVLPPQRLAKSVPAWNRIQAIDTAWPPATAMNSEIADGSLEYSAARAVPRTRQSAPRTACWTSTMASNPAWSVTGEVRLLLCNDLVGVLRRHRRADDPVAVGPGVAPHGPGRLAVEVTELRVEEGE